MDLLLIFFTGIVATTLGTLAGGGGLISLPVMLLIGMPVHSAIGANKVSNTFSSFSAFIYLVRRKQINIKESIWLLPVSLAGGGTGAAIASFLSSQTMTIAAIFLLMFAMVTSFFSKASFEKAEPFKKTPASAAGLYGIGIYDGLFGPGQGTLMLYLFSWLEISYLKAVGLVRLATFSSCIGAAAVYITAGHIIWGLTLALMAGSWIGAQTGVRLAQRMKAGYVKPMLRIITLLLIIQLLIEYLK
ncbi:sulfite exporter TauE/SafE family protein [Jeotgalibacillus sp. ET6]|uniref:sulfite exporter TauE/SafE family protein n=1 Tax=Jeotgalibacillus sp. ET6 TaxID=3037260 RepID=UPI002418B5AB|nr:sulfite exporter TauE/SafE family protein [Jeotgalibacillus sp. ET6]MDG5473509.1 sulfite exporter TauE/SafE family protein [Jeotgalibacillus sp. ET6]